MTKGKIRIALAAVLLSACTHTEVRQHAAVDPDARTIAVPSQKGRLLKGVVDELKGAGWKVTVEPEAPRQTAKPKGPPGGANDEAKPGNAKPDKEKADAEKKAASPAPARAAARYRLIADYREIDYCRAGRIVIYDFAIVDTKTGAKVLEQGGRECDRDVAAKFREALKGKSP